jgi:pimeloyl-ACP methyl ester carboxylesterase
MKNMQGQTFISTGKGNKTIVFIHYFGGSAESWRWVIDILAKDYTCLAFNLPGFGQTQISNDPSVEYYADFIKEELEKLNISQYILIGHSMGGKIAVELATQDEHKQIHQLILLGPSPPTIESMPKAEKTRMLKHPNEDVAKETVQKIIVNPLSAEQYALAVNTQLIIDQKVWQWWILKGMNIPVKRNPKYLTIPVTLISSENDPCITPKMINEEVLSTLPAQTQFISCKNIGHLYPLEAPVWLAEVIELIVKTH